MRVRCRHRSACLVLALAAISACKDDPPPRREPPPPPPARSAAACGGPSKANDPSNLSHFPQKSGSFCLDPAGSDRGYGKGAKQPLDGMCDLFDGECEIYRRFGVERVVEAHYVDGKGSGATIDVYLSQYGSTDGAYAMFTKRVVGDGDPGHPDTPRPVEGGGAAALGVGNAYLWRGPFVAELTYNDSRASAAQVEKQADALLPPLVAALGKKLPGAAELPPAAKTLPEEKRLPLGIRYLPKDVLDVQGIGPGAFGYYRDGDKRWRVLSMAPGDAAQAEDLVRTFGKQPGAAKEKDLGDEGVRFMHQSPGGPQSEWLVAHRGVTLFGVGDEPRVLREGMSADEHRAKTLSQDEKRELLKKLLAGP